MNREDMNREDMNREDMKREDMNRANQNRDDMNRENKNRQAMHRRDTVGEKTSAAVGQLLEQATRRPAPPVEVERAVRAAVRGEWRRLVGRRRRRRYVAVTGIAAAVLAATMLAVTRPTPEAPAPVAAIDQQFGAVYLVKDDAGLVPLGETRQLHTGDVVQTAKDAGLGLLIDGASVRIDADARLELRSAHRLYLQRGRVYVHTPKSSAPELVIRTDQGSVAHLGTQYLVAIAGDELTVAVREGEVRIDGRYYGANAAAGEQVTLRGTRRPAVDTVTRHGAAWRWTETLSPRPDLDGLPAAQFLAWVSEETGYRLSFDDDDARRIAAHTTLKGAVGQDPRTALALRLMTMDLAGEIDEARGEIRIRSAAP